MIKEFLRVPITSLSPGDCFFVLSSVSLDLRILVKISKPPRGLLRLLFLLLRKDVGWLSMKDSHFILKVEYLIIPFQSIKCDYFYFDQSVYVPLED